MRAITIEVVNAFQDGRNFKRGNTKVENRDGEAFLYLHDNMIAHKYADVLYITTCGWETTTTTTTKERLNGILRAFNLPTISQKNFVWYIGSEELKGNKNFKL